MTGRIPKHFIDELLTRTDIVSTIEARVPLKRTGTNYVACCPFHNEKTPSFTVTPSKQFYHCFGCGAHGTAIGFLMEYDRLSFPEAVESLARSAGLEVPKEATQLSAQTEEFKPLYDLTAQVGDYYRQQLKKSQVAVEYLKKRGLTGETAKDFGIGYAPPGWSNVLDLFGKSDPEKQKLLRVGLLIEKDDGGHYDRFRNRVIFPIRNRRGYIIGFGGRAIDPNDNPKYLNSPETPLFHKGRELYGLYEAQQQRPRPTAILVVEGYMDAVMLAQYGVRNAVATLGTATSRDHIQALFKAAPEIVFCFDGDNAGRQAAWRALEVALPELDDKHQIKFLFLPQGEDPDSFVLKHGREKFEALLKSAVSLATYLFDNLKQRFDVATLEGRARLAEEAKSLIAKTQDNVFRQLLLKELSDITRLDTRQLGFDKGGNAAIPQQRQIPRKDRSIQVKMNDMRMAVAALLAHPAIALDMQIPGTLKALDNPGLELLFEIIDAIRQKPDTTAARLREWFQDTPHADTVSKLAAYEFPDESETAVRQELVGALAQLDNKARARRYQELLEKIHNKTISEAEKQEFQSYRRS